MTMGVYSTAHVTRRDAIEALRIADYGKLSNDMLAQLLFVLVGDVPLHNFIVEDELGEDRLHTARGYDLRGWLDDLYEKEAASGEATDTD
jgi:hypothetical protein